MSHPCKFLYLFTITCNFNAQSICFRTISLTSVWRAFNELTILSIVWGRSHARNKRCLLLDTSRHDSDPSKFKFPCKFPCKF